MSHGETKFKLSNDAVCNLPIQITPEIVIDCDSFDNDNTNQYLLELNSNRNSNSNSQIPTHNYLSCKPNQEDSDSGIHELIQDSSTKYPSANYFQSRDLRKDYLSSNNKTSDPLYSGELPRKLLRSQSIKDSAYRSYSISCLPIEIDDIIATDYKNNSQLCRNCSTRNYFKNEPAIQRSDLYKPSVALLDAHTASVISGPNYLLVGDTCSPYPSRSSVSQDPQSISLSQQQQVHSIGRLSPIIVNSHQQQQRIPLQQQICKINVLLLMMKLLLGSTMSGLSFYIYRLSISISIQDCSFWAALPLFMSGLIDTALLRAAKRHNNRKLTLCILILCATLSLVCSGLCFMASVFTGVHGNWISSHSDNCYGSNLDLSQPAAAPLLAGSLSAGASTSRGIASHGLSDQVELTSHQCCYDTQLNRSHFQSIRNPNQWQWSIDRELLLKLFQSNLAVFPTYGNSRNTFKSRSNPISCICRDFINSSSNEEPTMIYIDLRCRYVFSALKDYFILQCALMAIGSGVSLWLLQITVATYLNRLSHSSNNNTTSTTNSELIQQHPMATRDNSIYSNINKSQPISILDCSRQSPIIPVKISTKYPTPPSLLILKMLM